MESFNFKLSFIYAIELGSDSYDQEFKTLEEARIALDAIALFLLHIQDKQVMPDYSNVAFIQEYVDGSWIELDLDED